MSALFSSFGGALALFCQRCQNPLPPNAVQCGYCGYHNLPVQSSLPESFFPSSNTPNSSVQPESQVNLSNQWYPGASDNSFPTAQPEGNADQQSMDGQLASFGNPGAHPFAATPMPQSMDGQLASFGNDQNPAAVYNAFPNQEQVNGFMPRFISAPQTPEVSQPVVVERRTLNMKKVVGLVVVLLIFVCASTAGYAVLTLQQGGKHTTSAPTGYPIPKGAPLFAETFTNNSQQWNMQSMQGRYLVSINKGNLILEDDDNKLFPMMLPGAKNFANFKLIINTMLSKGDRENGYGLCIRGTTDPSGYLTAYYRIELYGNSTYAIFKVATDANGDTSSTTLVETTSHAAIKPIGHSNQVVIVANGPKITLIVNGQTVQTFSDTSYASGVIALFVSNLPGTHPGAQAMFSHLAIYPVNAK